MTILGETLFLLTGDKIITGMHLRQRGFIYTACISFPNNKKRIQEFKDTGDSEYIYQDQQDQACFKHEMASVGFKDLPTETIEEKILCDKAFIFAKVPNYDWYEPGLASKDYILFEKNDCFPCK